MWFYVEGMWFVLVIMGKGKVCDDGGLIFVCFGVLKY